jgi:hypothetical protein
MKKWVRFLKRAREEQRDELNLAIVAAICWLWSWNCKHVQENVGFVRTDM